MMTPTDITIRPMEPCEYKYAYTQSSHLSDLTGFHGYYSCEVEADGPGWQTNWISYGNPGEPFFCDFAKVKEALRTDPRFGPCLSSLVEMKKFCERYPESKLRHIRRWDEYGFRIDTNQYTYLMHLVPVSFEMSCYIFGYDTEQLNDHINQAKEGIQFLHPLSGEELFRMADGDQIGVRTPGKEFEKKNCRYVDGSTIEVDGKETTPNDFAIAMFLQNSEFFPLRQSLPRKCFYYDAPKDRIMEIEKGDLGMSVSVLDAIDAPGGKASLVESYNRQLGVTDVQVAAMHHGCGYSWADPEADPEWDHHVTYEQTIYVDHHRLKTINGYLHTEPKDPEHCLDEDCTYIETARFDNGLEMDIKCCGVQFDEGSTNTAWTEAVLFKDGSQVAHTEPSSDFEGSWELEYEGNLYIVHVTADPATVPEKLETVKAIDIEWDVDKPEDAAHLPREIDIPSSLTNNDDISDYITGITGFCHRRFSVVRKVSLPARHGNTPWF